MAQELRTWDHQKHDALPQGQKGRILTVAKQDDLGWPHPQRPKEAKQIGTPLVELPSMEMVVEKDTESQALLVANSSTIIAKVKGGDSDAPSTGHSPSLHLAST
jgi:hypothetical protein